jgi:hypothetical protein
VTKREFEAFKAGFNNAKTKCLKVVDEWSRACHPRHPKDTGPTRDRCWQHHGLQAAKRSIKRDVKMFPVIP